VTYPVTVIRYLIVLIGRLRSTIRSTHVATMDTQQPRRQFPDLKFRVLIIGRANAGKTSILQRVCETTESPIVYRAKKGVFGDDDLEEVRSSAFLTASLISPSTRFNLTRPWMLVTMLLSSVVPKHRASEASTRSTTNLCSLTTRVTFFTIREESSRVAQRNLGFCKTSLDARAEKTSCVLGYMRYGLDSRVFTGATTDGHILKVLRPNGQSTTTARP
jgi:hypothetical protein